MRLLLDPSVLLAASASARGASREIFRMAPANQWDLVVTPYILGETLRNLPQLPLAATAAWPPLRASLLVMDDVLTLDLPTVFPASKDRPVLFSALERFS